MRNLFREVLIRMNNRIAILSLIAVLASLLAAACINTKSPDVKVVFFLTMIKSGNFNDARNYVDAGPFTRSIGKKVLELPDEAIVSILKGSGAPEAVASNFAATDEVRMRELRKNLEAVVMKDPASVTDLTLREMSTHIQNKDVDVVAQQVGEQTGEIHIRFTEAGKHPENMIFSIVKKDGDWLIDGMRDQPTGWLF